MLKTTQLFKKSLLKANDNEIVRGGSSADKTIMESSTSKKKIRIQNIKNIEKSHFLTSEAGKGFNCLKQVFIKTLIL